VWPADAGLQHSFPQPGAFYQEPLLKLRRILKIEPFQEITAIKGDGLFQLVNILAL
jgi:hypothetical protein